MAVGVLVNSLLPPSGGAADEIDPRTLFLVGMSERGSVDELIVIRSKAERASLIGDRTTYSQIVDQVDTFLDEAGDVGARVVLARVVGAGATKGTLTLMDRAGAGGVNTVRLDARDPGAHSADISVDVVDAAAVNTFTLRVLFRGELQETYANLDSPAALVAALATSQFLRAANLASVTAAPNNNPAVLAVTPLSAGTDDRASVTGPTHVAALARLTADQGPGVVAIPGQPHTVTAAGIAAHCALAGMRRIGLVAPPVGTTVVAAGAAARALRVTANMRFLGFQYPWLQIPDGAGGVRTISPEGGDAGRRARLGKTYRAPAGTAGRFVSVVGLERELTKDEINVLDADAVNCHRSSRGVTQLYGWRSLSLDEVNWRFLSYTDVGNELEARGEAALESLPFEVPDQAAFQQARTEVDAVAGPIARDRGLYPSPSGNDPGWEVDTGPAVNTAVSIAQGEIRAELAYRPSPVGQLVRLALRKVPLTSEL